MFKAGITGGIGSGKTIVCKVFKHLGVPVYDADSRARDIMDTDPLIRTGLIGKFGEQVYGDGGLNRKYLAQKIFSDSDSRQFVNSLVHPAVREDFHTWAENQYADYVIEEAALLFESGAYREMDLNILVYAPESLRIERVMQRDGISRNEVLARTASQIDPSEAANLADLVIPNDGKDFILPGVVSADSYIRKKAVRNAWNDI